MPETDERLGRVEERLGSVEHVVNELRGEVGTLHGEVGTLRGEVGTLRGEVGTLRGEVGTLNGKVGSLGGEVGTLRDEVQKLRVLSEQTASDLKLVAEVQGQHSTKLDEITRALEPLARLDNFVRLDRYAPRCANSVPVVPRMAVPGARSAPEDTGNQPRALPGYQGRSPWLVSHDHESRIQELEKRTGLRA